jgi:F0F1-type ATP synthase assembly protein I
VAEPNKPWPKLMAEYMALAVLLPVSTLAGFLIGYLLDRVFGTHFLKIVFLILGTVGGFVQLVRQIGQGTQDGGS